MARSVGSMSAMAMLQQPDSRSMPHDSGNRSKIARMSAFHSGREAKEFLISRIVAEAQRENVPLSEFERKMLYFTESGWTLPDMTAVSEHFDSEYNQNEYEHKIARLIRNAAKHDRKESRGEYDTWWDAIHFLRTEDHYISVMIGIAGLRPAGDLSRLLAISFASAACLLATIFLLAKYQINLPSRGAVSFYIWATGTCVVIAYLLLRFIIGRKRVDDLTSSVLEKLVRIYQRAR